MMNLSSFSFFNSRLVLSLSFFFFCLRLSLSLMNGFFFWNDTLPLFFLPFFHLRNKYIYTQIYIHQFVSYNNLRIFSLFSYFSFFLFDVDESNQWMLLRFMPVLIISWVFLSFWWSAGTPAMTRYRGFHSLFVLNHSRDFLIGVCEYALLAFGHHSSVKLCSGNFENRQRDDTASAWAQTWMAPKKLVCISFFRRFAIAHYY